MKIGNYIVNYQLQSRCGFQFYRFYDFNIWFCQIGYFVIHMKKEVV